MEPGRLIIDENGINLPSIEDIYNSLLEEWSSMFPGKETLREDNRLSPQGQLLMSLAKQIDYKNREIDAVIELPDGNWCAFEIKLGANQIDQAAESLLKIKQEFEEDKKSVPPSVLCVICGLSNAAYKREDGVFVVPITALKDWK